MQPVTIFIGGTAVERHFGRLLYGPIMQACGEVVFKALPMLGLAPLDWTYRHLARDLDRQFDGGQALRLVGVSQAGVHAVRYALDRDHVQAVTTVGTPHHGTLAARIARAAGPLGHGLCGMEPENMAAYIERLPQIGGRLSSYYFRHDWLIRPYYSAHVDGAQNFLFATPDEYRQTGEQMFDTTRLDGNANHWTEGFCGPLVRALREAYMASTLPAA